MRRQGGRAAVGGARRGKGGDARGWERRRLEVRRGRRLPPALPAPARRPTAEVRREALHHGGGATYRAGRLPDWRLRWHQWRRASVRAGPWVHQRALYHASDPTGWLVPRPRAGARCIQTAKKIAVAIFTRGPSLLAAICQGGAVARSSHIGARESPVSQAMQGTCTSKPCKAL